MVLLFLRLSTRQIRRPHNEFHLLQPMLWSLHTVRSLIFPLVAKASACRRGQEAQYLHRKASPFLPELPRISGMGPRAPDSCLACRCRMPPPCPPPSALVLAGGEQTKNLRERSGSATEKEKPEPCEISDHRPSTPPHLGRSQCRPFGAGPCPSGERPGPWPPAGGGCGVQEGHTQRAPEARRPVT